VELVACEQLSDFKQRSVLGLCDAERLVRQDGHVISFGDKV
jgi:hypothetical protein